MEILHKKFVELGAQRHKLLHQLLAILPEIYKRKIYKKYAASIFEYAAKFAGIGKSTVEKRLRLEKHLVGKPRLKAAIAELGVNKVSLVATITTAENESEMVDRIRHMSKDSVQMMSKEMRGNAVRVAKVELDEEMLFMLEKLKKAEKVQRGNQEMLRKLLKAAYEKEFGKEDKKIQNSVPGDKSQSRKPSKNQQRVALKKTKGRCHYCPKAAEEFHHQDPWSRSRSHDSITPVCREHHQLVHNGVYGELSEVDHQYRKVRQSLITDDFEFPD